MKRKISILQLVGYAAIFTTGTLLLGQNSTAQQVEKATDATLMELRSLKQLPPTLKDRARIADKAMVLVPRDAPAYLLHTYHSSLLAPPFVPAPRRIVTVTAQLQPQAFGLGLSCSWDQIYSQGAFPSIVHQHENDADPAGCQGTYLPNGPVTTTTNAFFKVLGTNGRSCATCHQPPSGMSVSKANIVARLQATHGTDPIFAAVDGANCPTNAPPFTGSGTAFKAAHSLLLQRGLFRVSLPLPANAEFTVSAQGNDPNGCNTQPPFNADTVNGQTVQMVSFYRRPRISANLNFVLAFVQLPPPVPPAAPAIMWDEREATLEQQVIDATFGHGHAQSLTPPTAAEVTQMVNFEKGVFSAQSRDAIAGNLSAVGAKGGPVKLAAAPTGLGFPPPSIAFDEYNAWAGLNGGPISARRASIERGQKLFSAKTFTIANVAGLNNAPGVPSPLVGTCASCHNQTHAGNDVLGNVGGHDLGIGGDSVAHNGPAPSALLPIFTVTCTGGASTPFNGTMVTTNDLGRAMITGKCADIGRFSIPQLRALASHAPFFHDGSAQTLTQVVKFYNKRFSINYTPNEMSDLVHFLNAL